MILEYLILRLRSFLASTEAASAIEYAIVVAMVAVVVVVFITPLGAKIFAIFNSVWYPSAAPRRPLRCKPLM
jgi:pilus assembly protein Flp/PilA